MRATGAPTKSIGQRQHTNWDRARLSVVVPVGVIVAVAILCIVIAVLTSAHRADHNAIEHERQLFARAIESQSERTLRQVSSVLSSDNVIGNIGQNLDAGWMDRNVSRWLETFYSHDAVFVIDGDGRVVYNYAGLRPSEAWPDDARLDLLPVTEQMRSNTRAILTQTFVGRPAIVAAVAFGSQDAGASAMSPFVASVRFIDAELLSEVASRLNFYGLRQLAAGEEPRQGEATYVLADTTGSAIGRFAWAPQQPGSEIVDNVVPYFAVALAGFALLAAFVLRYMRRTAATIAVGESRLRHLAMHDPLCGLPNRIFFGERLETVISQVRNGSEPAALFYIDLDHFKEVNDTLGHPVGDELIRNVTLRLSRTLRGDDLVARLGGDEFAIISSIGDDPDKIMGIANRILAALCAPYAIGQHNLVIGASIGIAAIDENCGGAADVMRYADMALYRAKNEGRNRACVYDEAMDAALSNRKLLETDLREAIETNALELLYQPLVNASGEKIIGVEALCRWTHPKRGVVSPADFIPVAEHSGLIIELGEWVLRRACLDGRRWPGITVAANVSPLQFRRGDFVAMVERVLQQTQFDPKALELELTESTLIGNVEVAEAAMLRLKAMGVRLALDDFGTGYSSLQYLRRFPFDKLKIDQSFVQSIEKTADAAAIVHAVVSLGRGLGMKVTAEGVETADQQLFLRAAGVHSMQGYRFGKAVSAAEITERLNRTKGQPTGRTALAG